MNLSEKLAAADGTGAPAEPALPPAENVTPQRSRREGDGSTQPFIERRVVGGSVENGAKGHPLRRSTDRAALDSAWKQSKQKVQARVLAEIAPTAADLSPDELRDKVRSTVNDILEREDIGISPIERQRFVEEMLEDSLGYGPLEALLSDGSITEIMCNKFDEIWIERKGKLLRSEVVFNTPHQYRRIIDRMVHGVGRRVDESSPMVDARLADGSRINAIVPPLALHGPVLTIRKFPERGSGHAGPDRSRLAFDGRCSLLGSPGSRKDQSDRGRRYRNWEDDNVERALQLHSRRRAFDHN